ncbi:group II intron maturase-specific domain-containing protein [Pseudonocardia sp.]|uniref:group II intron maturase-specific domain-containing protein n=1 Tax=Pseudonocardia sp. TaxID=60912 RepID=UPI00345BF921
MTSPARSTNLRGWCAYFRHGVSKSTFGYLDMFAWRRVTAWLRKRHPRMTWEQLYRRYLTGRPGNRPQENPTVMVDAATVVVTRYRWRASNIPTPRTLGVVPRSWTPQVCVQLQEEHADVLREHIESLGRRLGRQAVRAGPHRNVRLVVP